MESVGTEADKKQPILVVVAVVLVAALLLVWAFLYSGKSSQEKTETRSTKEVGVALEKVSAPSTVEVPTSVNPVKQVLPDENPVDKANPFNKVYKNPFDE